MNARARPTAASGPQLAPSRSAPAGPRLDAEQRRTLLLIAGVHLRLGRPRRASWLAGIVQRAEPDLPEAARILMAAYLALGRPQDAFDQIDRLLEHEYDGAELAIAMRAQSLALAALGRAEEARRVWAEMTALLRVSDPADRGR